MVTPTYPGVYIEEVSSGVRPITAASTSTAAFIGEAEKGSLSQAVKIYNFTQFQNLYGGFLSDAYLAHSVYQFFNNGGSQCYIVRVAGANVRTAAIGIADRAGAPQLSMSVSAVSPGYWGNQIEVVVNNGTMNPGNEFNLAVYWNGETTPREVFENLSMVPAAANYVEKVTSGSHYISVSVNEANTNAVAGTSVGAAAPTVPLTAERRRFRINVNSDGYQEVNLGDAIGGGAGQVANLDTADNVRDAITYVVTQLTPQRSTTPAAAFSSFACTLGGGGELILTSGSAGVASSVNVAPASSATQDATGLLAIGTLRGGVETLGGAVTRPVANSVAVPRYLVGDHATPATGVVNGSVVDGYDGDAITDDTPYSAALQRLNDKDDVSLIAAPGRGSSIMVSAGMAYCENTQYRPLRDCFFIGDMALDDDTVPEMQTFVNALSPKNSYGAVYGPWLLMLDPSGQSKQPIEVPPSGFIAGMYAKTDAQRGVWKAPAGTAAGLAGATGLAAILTDVEQGNLNPDPYNVNLIRHFPAAGRVIWGARTITSDAEWRYVPVRRTAIMLRVSIYRGIQWAVFEPNDEELWSQLRLNIGSFMMTLFRRGAFQGSTPDDGFFVKCDSETTTQDDIDQGIVNVLVGFAPLKPAEFVIVKISQKAGQPS